MPRQEVGRRVARELRVVGQRDRAPNRPSPGRARAARRRPQTSGRSKPSSARRLAGVDADPVAHRHALSALVAAAAGEPRAQARPPGRGEAQARSARRSCDAPRARAAMRLHRGDEDLGAVRVVAEHVQAGAGRAEQHRVAALRPARSTSAVAASQACRGAAAARRSRPSAASIARGVAADQRDGARVARAPARPAARSPGPCRRRRGSRPACAGARSAPRPSSAATVAPTLVPLLSSKASTPPTLADVARRGAARRGTRAGRAASAPAGSRSPWPAPARPARWRRCGGRGCAARRPASGAAGGSPRPRSRLRA